jgi:hypothetical protein
MNIMMDGDEYKVACSAFDRIYKAMDGHFVYRIAQAVSTSEMVRQSSAHAPLLHFSIAALCCISHEVPKKNEQLTQQANPCSRPLRATQRRHFFLKTRNRATLSAVFWQVMQHMGL